MNKKTAVILGASGSVGKALLDEVLKSDNFNRVVIILRKSLGDIIRDSRIEEKIVPDMNPVNLKQAVINCLQNCESAVGFSVLGVGANTAKMTLDEHRAIDVELNKAFAEGLKESAKVEHLAFMSAVGADIKAKTTGSGAAGMSRYNRVKGEAEAAVLSHGPKVVSIFRPSIIVGSIHTPKLISALFSMISFLIPKALRPIRTDEIAKAMVAVTKNNTDKNLVYSYSEMKELI